MRVDGAVHSAALMNRLGAVADRGSVPAFNSMLAKAASEEEVTRSGKSHPTTEQLLEKLRDYIEKGPIAAMREKILESMGLTEDELKTLPPDKQDAVETEIARRIKEMLLKQQEAKNTSQTNPQTATRAAAFWAESASAATQ